MLINRMNALLIMRNNTDMPFIIMLDEDENGYKAGRF